MVIKMKKYIGGIIVIFTVCLLTIIDSKRSQIVKEDVAERNILIYGSVGLSFQPLILLRTDRWNATGI